VRVPALKISNPFHINAVAAREFVSRMRSARAYTIITIYLAIVSALAVLLYAVSFLGSTRTVGSSGQVGTVVFYFLVGMQVLLVSFVAPAFTVGAISNERERGTFELLRTTLVSPRQIVLAKLAAALGFTLVLIFATLPLFSLAFLLGGVEPVELLIVMSVVLSSALFFSLLGLYASARSRTTLGATVVTYAVTLGIVIGIPLASLIGSSTIQLALPSMGRTSVLASLAETLLTLAISFSPISAVVASQRFFAITGDVWRFNPAFVSSALSVTTPSPFIILTVTYLIASLILFALCVRRVSRSEPV
jgi:ABC-type transport system involved in multi-copper enzyme maturation permease subunit